MIAMESLLQAQMIPPGQGRVVHAFGEEVIFHLDGANTGGQLTLWTEITPPGGGPPPHYHLNEDEWFLVQEGRVGFYSEGQWHEMSPGSVVYIPRKHVHAFKNVGQAPARQIIATNPSGFETFFGKCAEEFARPGGPDMKRIVEIGIEHGIHFVHE